jgi:hypothetical protein
LRKACVFPNPQIIIITILNSLLQQVFVVLPF